MRLQEPQQQRRITAAQVARIVAAPKWAGGVHRNHLADLLGCTRADLTRAVMIAYHRGAVDFVRGYVVKPSKERRP